MKVKQYDLRSMIMNNDAILIEWPAVIDENRLNDALFLNL